MRSFVFRSTILMVSVFVMNGCAYREVIQKPLDQVVKTSLMVDSLTFESHLDTLSSDYFMGRMPFSLGDERTVDYLVQEVEACGLMPGNNSSYLQEVPMVEIDGTPSPTLDITVDDMILPLVLGADYIIHSERPAEVLEWKELPLVFCGYGIVAPEYGWNDYAGMDMKGKIALVLVNDPGLGGEDSTFFKGDIMTYYGRWTYKYEEADRQGAAGLLLIHETNMAGYPWQVVSSSWAGPQLHLDRGADAEDCGIKGWIHLEKAKELMSVMGKDLSKLLKASRQPGFKPVPLEAKATVRLDNQMKRNTSSNVIGYKKGTKYPDETIVVTAHWDHLGVGVPIQGDSIYNGALDNASGTALALAMAKAIEKTEWERSVVFLFVTAEEQGLIGSKWYVENPLFALDKTIANINIDGINLIGLSKDLTVTGLGHSDMDEVAVRFAAAQGRYVQGESEPEKGYFFRSDHFNFAKHGVPALYAKGGTDHKEKGKEYAKEVSDEYVAQNYHQPSDEYQSGDWNLHGALQDGDLMLQVIQELAKSRFLPQWKEGSEFKAADVRDVGVD